MRKLGLIAMFFSALAVLADTPPPGTVTIKGATTSTTIGNVTDSLKVNVTNSPSITGSVSVSNFPASYPVTGSLGRTWSLLNTTDSVNVGNFPTSFNVGNFPSSFGVSSLPSLVAGSALIGKVGIDQTTPGTTNKVSIGTDGTVALNAALPSGSNTIGAVTQASGPWTLNLTQFGSNAVVTGTGAGGSGIPRVTVSNDSNVLATQSGTWSTRTQDGSGNAITSTSSALDVNIKSGSSSGTQYTQGASQASPVGTVAMAKTAGNVINALSLDGSGNLNVNLAAGSITGGNAAASATGAAVPASADYTGYNSGGNLVGVSTANPLPVAAQNATPAGTNLIGKVGIDQTTPGTTNKVSIGTDGTVALNAAVPAGSNIIGNVRVDQTTPGTTNGVSLAQVGSTTIAAGNGVAGAGVQRVAIASDNTAFSVNAAVTGTVTANQGTANATPWLVTGTGGTFPVTGTITTTPPSNASTNVTQFGSNNVATGTGAGGVGIPRVTVSNDSTVGLVAGSALVGKVGIDQTTPGTTNKVSIGTDGTVAINTALPAGSNIVGNVRVDQTTPGTTNGVSLAQVGSTTIASGNGVAGAGVQRVAIASDNTAFPVNATVQASSNIIGNVRIDQTTPGTTNGVQVNAALPAGTNLIGKTGIDQSTPGTTNKVSIGTDGTVAINTALPAGTNLVGKVGIDQTTPGTTNGVQVNAALPAGTNLIGKTGIDQTTPGTTNKVSIGTDGTVALNAAVPAGSNIIGNVRVDQTTPGTTNGVSLAHIGSTAVASGNGVVSAGVQRVAIASDNSAISTKVQDGSGNAITSTSSALDVNIKSGASSGTQYTQGASQASPVGTVAMAKTAGNVINALALDASGNLNVNVAAGSITGGNAAAGATGAAVPASADYTGFNSGGNLVGVSTANALPVAVQNAIPAGTNIIGKTGIDQTTPGTTNAVYVTGVDGSAVLTGNGVTGAGSQRVTVASDNTPFAVKIDQTTPGTTNAVVAEGDVASGAADSGPPLKIGGVAQNVVPTSTATGNRINANYDLAGRAIVAYSDRALAKRGSAITLASTTETTILAATAATYNDLTGIMVSNTSTTTAVRIDFRDATAGTIQFSLSLAANGGAVIMPPVPFNQTTVNNNWTAQLSVVGPSVRLTVFAIARK